MTALLVVCGLHREAALVGGPGIVTVVGGGDRAALETRLAALDDRSFDAVVSAGLAGALDPALAVGDVVIPEAVLSGSDPTGHAVSRGLADRLANAAASRGIRIADRSAIAAGDLPAATAAAKAAIRATTGAAAIDMESHIAAGFAERRGLPFAVLRVVSDAADRDIPDAALKAMRSDGGIDVPAVLLSLLRDPGQVPSLLRLARDGARAFRVLRSLGEACRDVAVSSPR